MLSKQEQEHETKKWLDNRRKNLLDLTKRNSLINFKLTGSKVLCFFNASIEKFYELIDNNSRLIITGLPELPKNMKYLFLGIPTNATPTFQKTYLEKEEVDLLKRIYNLISVKGVVTRKIESLSYDFDIRQHIKIEPIDFESLLNLQKKIAPNCPSSENFLRGIYSSCISLEDFFPSTPKEFRIQTLLDEKHLAAKAMKIYRDEQTLEQEKGTSFSYLILGFLNWKESDDSDIELKSPLFSVPVVINRTKEDGVFVFDIQKSAEEIKINLSLKEKLNYAFGVDIPNIEFGEKPLEYFEKVKKHLDSYIKNKGWYISSEVALSILDFSKLVMYRDLDPKLWEPNNKLSEHPVIRNLIGFSDESSESVRVNDSISSNNHEESVNNLINSAKKLKLVESADITQIKAIIDVLKSQQSYIIKGPPGTGKSQTITNLIALALYEGKKILFVSEKRAALEVVKSKLDKIGLGEFCLELHSEKNTKEDVIKDLYSVLCNTDLYSVSRHTKSYSKDHEHELYTRYADIENNMDEYVNTLHTKWENSGKTIYEILNKVVLLRECCKADLEPIEPIKFSPKNFTLDYENRIQQALDDFLKILDNLEKRTQGNLPVTEHPWRGTNITLNTPSKIEQIYSSLLKWQNQLNGLFIEIKKISGFNPDCSLSNIEKLPDILKQYSIDFSIIDLNLLQKLSDKDFENKLLYVLESIFNSKELFTEITKNNDLSDSFYQKLKNLRQHNIYESDESVEECQLPDNITILELSQLYNDISNKNNYLNNYYKLINKLYQKNDNSHKTCILYSIQSGETVADFIELISSLPNNAIKYRKILNNFNRLKITEVISDLKEYTDSLETVSKILNNSDSTTFDEISQLCNEYTSGFWIFSFLSSSHRNATKKLKRISTSGAPKEILKNYDSISKYYKCLNTINNNQDYAKIINNYFDKSVPPTQILNILESLNAWNHSIDRKFGPLFSDNSELKSLLITIDDSDFDILKNDPKVDSISIKNEVYDLIHIKNQYTDFFNHLSFSENEIGDSGELKNASDSIKQILLKLQSIFKNHNINLGYCKSVIDKIKKLQDSCKTISDNSSWLKEEIIPKDKKWNSLFDEIPNIDIIRETLKLKKKLSIIGLTNITVYLKSIDELQKLESNLSDIVNYYNNSVSSADNFYKEIESNAKDWGINFKESLIKAILRNQEALDNKENLTDFISLTMALKNTENLGIKKYAEATLKNQINRSDLKNKVFLDLYNSMVDEIYSNTPLISKITGSQLDNFKESYMKLDKDLFKARRILIKNKLYQYQLGVVSDRNNLRKNGTKVKDLTEIPLIQNEGQKIKRHLALRQLFKRAPNTTVGLKPCFMMSPLSVANYIEPGVINFDLLIMDEASQVKPADALGAIARAKQFVIVGDEKQMPPSNYFEASMDSDEKNNDDDDLIEGNESILEAGLSAGFPTNILKWHYRSRHESLIYFSNKHFYDNQLVVFPSPKNNTSDYGIKFKYIEDGYFSKGQNIVEAQKIVEATIEQIIKHPDESLAIVAMNKEQSSLIEDILTQQILINAEAGAAWTKINDSKEPLLIKNLETIQGDERDVVFISCTYGKDPEAQKVYQRFGPINSVGGERRLNVLFSRAKKRMQIFSSMLPEDICQTESKGTQLLKDFLYYAKNGIVKATGCTTGREPDSDFEKAVTNLLTSNGYECEPQVGVQGYFIDIAIKDPKHSGEYIMGIECDGATYHSSSFARDRDCLRQQILENLGWKIRRIWSTDWFRNPKGTLKPILDELSTLTSKGISK